MRLTVDTVRFPDGSEGQLEMIRHVGASAVLPFVGALSDPDPDVLLVRQYRYASDGYLYEVPAGLLGGPEETWEECAHRELEEETGMRASRMTPLTRIYTTPGFTDEVIRLFVATDLVRCAEKVTSSANTPAPQAIPMAFDHHSGERPTPRPPAASNTQRKFV